MDKFETEQKDSRGAKEILKSLRQFFNSYLFYGIETIVACLFVILREEVIGVVSFAALISLILLVCEDILPTTLPFLLLCTFSTNCYDSYDTFMSYAIYAPIVILALIAHFVVYHKPFRLGQSVYGICGVSIALLLGGIGNFGFMEYVYGSYYILGLGVGMIVCYILMKSQFSSRRDYDFRERFSVIMTLVGTLCVAMIFIGHLREWLGLPYYIQADRGFSPNNLATLLMFALPFPLFLERRNAYLVLLMFLFYAGLCLTESRGGLLLGSVELAVCCVYWVYEGKNRKFRLGCCCIAIIVVLLSCGKTIWGVLVDRVFAENGIIGGDRYNMIPQAIERFLKNPLTGSGILDNTINYGAYKKQGTMAWYHMMIPQVFGSMGLIGVAAYGYQILGRIKLIFTKMNNWSLILGISYFGILMMSQVNPGEFCPLPFELLTVLLFILQEKRLEEEKLPLCVDRRGKFIKTSV